MAKKFKLQTVLKYRKILEEQAQQRVAELLSVEAKIKEQQVVSRTQVETLSRSLQIKQQEGLSVLDLRLYEDQIDHQRRLDENLRQQLEELCDQLSERRQDLLIAARECKIIEKLKEKQLAEYLSKLDRDEQIMLDEISLRLKGGLE